jgi:LmbE family N-acetylglucosaminyl deacetylase
LESDMNTPLNTPVILAIFAHPDDETMFLGGTLAYLAAQGATVHYLCATRGEGGEMGDPPLCTRSELGQVREKELQCAVKALGGASLSFLGFEDPVAGPEGELYPFSESLEPVIREISKHLDEIQPDVILTHGPEGEYGHPAHIQTNQAVMAALDTLPFSPDVIYSPAWLSRETGEFTPAPGILVDTSPWISQKVAAVTCHVSQHGLFLRHGAARAGRPVTIPEMVRSQEALCRIYPAGEMTEDSLVVLLHPLSLPLPEAQANS